MNSESKLILYMAVIALFGAILLALLIVLGDAAGQSNAYGVAVQVEEYGQRVAGELVQVETEAGAWAGQTDADGQAEFIVSGSSLLVEVRDIARHYQPSSQYTLGVKIELGQPASPLPTPSPTSGPTFEPGGSPVMLPIVRNGVQQ